MSVGVTTLTLTASLKNASGNDVGGLEGNTTIPFSSCWANFTDLSILNSGTLAFVLNSVAETGARIQDSPTLV